MILKAFLSQLPEERRNALLHFLPEAEQQRLKETEAAGFGYDESNFKILDKVHWSWFLPTLKSYEEGEQKIFIAALHKAAAESLKGELKIEGNLDISPAAQEYFQQVLTNSLTGHRREMLPIDFLPDSPLKPLLNLSKKELIRLIDLLSLYDLSVELRQIVETKILKKIYSFLSDEDRKFLGQIMAQHKEPLVLARMGLDRWDGTEEMLRHSLHRRGLARLGAALSGEDPDLIWYICHQLDIGRGNALLKLISKEPIPDVTEPIRRQIEELLVNKESKL